MYFVFFILHVTHKLHSNHVQRFNSLRCVVFMLNIIVAITDIHIPATVQIFILLNT